MQSDDVDLNLLAELEANATPTLQERTVHLLMQSTELQAKQAMLSESLAAFNKEIASVQTLALREIASALKSISGHLAVVVKLLTDEMVAHDLARTGPNQEQASARVRTLPEQLKER